MYENHIVYVIMESNQCVLVSDVFVLWLMLMCRQNAIQLEEKEKREKEVLNRIIEEANQYKVEFHKKVEVTCENNKAANREKEKVCSFFFAKDL